jgi:pimeloyl-ACP methyl ester carboxylesterase
MPRTCACLLWQHFVEPDNSHRLGPGLPAYPAELLKAHLVLLGVDLAILLGHSRHFNQAAVAARGRARRCTAAVAAAPAGAAGTCGTLVSQA